MGFRWVVSPLFPFFRYSLFTLTRVFFPEELDMGPPSSPGEYIPKFSFHTPLPEFPLPLEITSQGSLLIRFTHLHGS